MCPGTAEEAEALVLLIRIAAMRTQQPSRLNRSSVSASIDMIAARKAFLGGPASDIGIVTTPLTIASVPASLSESSLSFGVNRLTWARSNRGWTISVVRADSKGG